MISSKKLLGGLVVVMTSPFAYAVDTCVWKDGNVGPIPYNINIGAHYVPKDVPRGTAIGPVDRRYGPVNGGGLAIDCLTQGPRIDFKARSHQPIAPGNFPPINGEEVTGKVIQTNIDGIGVRVKLGDPYTSYWTRVGDSDAVPYDAYIARFMPNVLSHSILAPRITLVKTGDIAPGSHALTVPDLLGGEFTGIGNGFNMSLSGTVIQAECTLSGNPVSADPVDLGAWDHSVFTRVGHTTAPTPFEITLNSCVADNRVPPQTQTYAHIRLDPTAGSTIHDALTGQFTLGTGSTAKGVVIQMLRDNETPLPLASNEKTDDPISPGITTLKFKARLFQTEPPERVEAGSIQGSLSFTITYL
jgi:type 1 fimbria pilin